MHGNAEAGVPLATHPCRARVLRGSEVQGVNYLDYCCATGGNVRHSEIIVDLHWPQRTVFGTLPHFFMGTISVAIDYSCIVCYAVV